MPDPVASFPSRPSGSPRAVAAPLPSLPDVPLNAWSARAGAFAAAATAARGEAHRLRQAAPGGPSPDEVQRRAQGFAAAATLEAFAQWLDRCREQAGAQGRAPMTTPAEHFVRKATAAVRAAARAWRAT